MDELTFEDAKDRYFQVLRSQGYAQDQIAIPANTSVCEDDGTWVLHNCNGVLARVKPDGKVVFPTEHEEAVY